MSGQPGNIFQVLGGFTGDLAKSELADLKELQKNEERLTAIELINRVDEDVNRYLIEKQEGYNHDGTLAAGAEIYYNERSQAILDGVENDNVRHLVQQNLKSGEADYVQRAQNLQLQKHKTHQRTLWVNNVARDKAANPKGDETILLNQIKKWSDNPDGYAQNLRDELLPATLSDLTAGTLETRLSLLELKQAQGADPESINTELDILQQTIVNKPDIYKLTPAAIDNYNQRINKKKAGVAKDYTAQFAANYKSELTGALELMASGDITPEDALSSYQSNSRYLTNEEKVKFNNKVQAGLLSYDVMQSAKQVDDEGEKTGLFRFDKAINQAKKSKDFDLATELMAQREKVQTELLALDDKLTTNSSDFFASDITYSTLKAEGNLAAAIEYSVQNSNGKITAANVSPLNSGEIQQLNNRIGVLKHNPEELKKFMIAEGGKWQGHIQSLGGMSVFDATIRQLVREVGSKRKDMDAELSVDESILLAFQYLDSPNFNQIISYLLADTTLTKDRSAVKKDTYDAVKRFHTSFKQYGDIAQNRLPGNVNAKLVEKLAFGIAASPEGQVMLANPGKKAYELTIGEKWVEASGLDGKIFIPKELDHEIIKRALKDPKGNYLMAKRLLLNKNVINETFDFSEPIRLAKKEIEITEQAIRNRGHFKPMTTKDGLGFRLYLKTGSKPLPPYRVVNGKVEYFELSAQEYVELYQSEKAKQRMKDEATKRAVPFPVMRTNFESEYEI